jgi:hypothetical protein
VLFVLVLLAHHRRRIVYFAITDHATAAWTAQQIVEASGLTRPLDASCETGTRFTAMRFGAA